MSAYIVDKKLIDALLTYGLSQREFGPLAWLWPKTQHPNSYQRGEAIPAVSVIVAQETRATLTRESVERVGQVLWDENVLSVNHRYDEQEPTGAYGYQPFMQDVSPANILGLLDCLTYQSCEHPEWETSEAYTILESIKSAAIHALPGYEWTLPK